MGLINWLFDFYQHSKIDEARDEARRARAELARMHGRGSLRSEPIERALGELALATKTLQRLLVERGLCSTADLTRIAREIDREDGVEDGQSPWR